MSIQFTNLLAAIGTINVSRVREIISQDPSIIHELSPSGYTPLYIALTNCYTLTRTHKFRLRDHNPDITTHIVNSYQIVDSLLDAGANVPPQFVSSTIVKKYWKKKHQIKLI